jgi:probable phosphoglycerate mutase
MGNARGRGSRVTRILIVRHGEAEGNREHRFIGQSDVPLTAHGRQQVAALTPRLAAIGITRVVSSDLQRAASTVTPVAELLGLDVEHDVRFREIANGEWANLVAADVEERFPDLWARYRGGEDVERPGGECWTDVQVRAVAALEELLAGVGADDTVLVGTHAGPALGMLRWAIGLPQHGSVWAGPFGQLHNTSISTISIPGPRLHTVNDTGHLSEPEGLFV